MTGYFPLRVRLSTIFTAAGLFTAIPHNLEASQDPQPQKAQTATLATNAESSKRPNVQDSPAPDLTVNFDPAAGTPPPPSRPRQVPMIVLVIIWLSIVTFWYLRKTRDPQPPSQ